MNEVKISPPWLTFFREVHELFKEDPEVIPIYDDDEKRLILRVRNYEKAEALKKIFPTKKSFGNVSVNIEIEYQGADTSIENTFNIAFKGNPAFKYTFSAKTNTNDITYVVFEKKVVQYWNDDLSDPHGVTSTLYANIADHVFECKGIIYSTDSGEDACKNNYNRQATAEEIKEWEKYNGKDSFGNGSKICDTLINKENFNKKPTEVKDQKTFKAIFNRK